MRLLVDWLQIHPGIPRVQAHSAQATANAGDNTTLGRAWVPEHDIDIDALNTRLAGAPAASLDEFMAHITALVTVETGLHADAQEPAPLPPAPEPSDTEAGTASV
jgi:hypothetical protein